MKVLLLFFLLLALLASFSQNAKIDSLKSVIETTKVDTVKGRTLCRLCLELSKGGQMDSALSVATLGLQTAKSSGDIEGRIHCRMIAGHIHLQAGDFSKALQHFNQNVEECEKAKRMMCVAKNLQNIGFVHSDQGDQVRALEYLLKCLSIYEKLNAQMETANVLADLGIIYWKQNDFDQALEYFHRSVELRKLSKDLQGTAKTLNNIGLVFAQRKEYDQALDYFHRSLDLHDRDEKSKEVASCYSNIANMLVKKGMLSDALIFFQKGINIQYEIGDKIGLISSIVSMANLYFELGDFGVARRLASEGMDEANRLGWLEGKSPASQALYRADSALGDWKGAFEAHRLFKIYSDSLKNDDQSKEIGRVEAQYAADKEREALESRQRVELERYNWVIGSSIGGLLLMMLVAFTFLRGRQRERQANAELRALNDQISEQKTEIEAQNSAISAINAELQITLEEVDEQRRSLEESNAQLKEAQEQLLSEQSSREQAQRMAGIGEISAIVAHEVNTPLGAIKGGAQNLIDRLGQNAPSPELLPLLQRAAQAQPLSSREERAALRKLEPACEEAGFARPEDAARQLVACGLHDLDDPQTLAQLAGSPQALSQLVQSGSFLAQAANIQRAAERAASIITALKTYANLGCRSETGGDSAGVGRRDARPCSQALRLLSGSRRRAEHGPDRRASSGCHRRGRTGPDMDQAAAQLHLRHEPEGQA